MAITPNTPNPVREDAYAEALAEKLGIPAEYIPKSPVYRNEEELAYLVELFTNMTSGLVESKKKDVNFYDMGGNRVCSYTAEEFAALTEMPPNAPYAGMTPLGWNWSLSDAKAYVASYGRLDVGQQYTTEDGKTRIYVQLNSDTLSPYLGFCLDGSAVIDWGDGDTETVTGNDIETNMFTKHVYENAGEYVITIDVDGDLCIYGDSDGGRLLVKDPAVASSINCGYLTCIRRVEIGGNVSVKGQAFNFCACLESVNLPSGITKIDDYMFYGCARLKCVVVPDGVTELGDHSAYAAYSLWHVLLPNGLTTIGASSLRGSILSDLTIPNTVTSMGESSIRNSYTLNKLVIPDSVTSIGNNAFQGMMMSTVTIGSGVTSIGASAFQACGGLCGIHFKPTTPPVAANSNAFASLPTDCIIYVPEGSLAAYKAASNYPDPDTYTYIEE